MAEKICKVLATSVTIAIIFCLFALAFFSNDEIPNDYKKVEDYTVWVSPDGVQYWFSGRGMTPRYDHEGNLVIENWDVE